MGIPIGGLYCGQNICLEYALESRGLVCLRKMEPVVPRGAPGSWTQRKSLKEKSLFLSSPFSWSSDGRLRMCGLGALGRTTFNL